MNPRTGCEIAPVWPRDLPILVHGQKVPGWERELIQVGRNVLGVVENRPSIVILECDASDL
jgi:hypothetical protein